MLTLVRYTRTETAILGSLYLNGAFVCYTLENEAKAIPCGMYTVHNSKSPKFKRELPLLTSGKVSASRGIRIHVGNTAKDSQGCVLVGMTREVHLLGGSKLNESKNAETMVTMICRNESNLVIVDNYKQGMTDK
ncbi:DUF5675 family protein [Fibrobacter succinogenes]|uniref:DUF5675 family protein n=1 Tax=Fibrobacter succinogenes TaxID=833 RepID=UPI0015680239|nr:DUF5675 family protein [Fibrobacter succinogenes]